MTHLDAIRAAIEAIIAQEAVVEAAQTARYDRTDPRSNHQKATALHNTRRKLNRLEREADDLIFTSRTRDALGREGQNAFYLALRTTFYSPETLAVLDTLTEAHHAAP